MSREARSAVHSVMAQRREKNISQPIVGLAGETGKLAHGGGSLCFADASDRTPPVTSPVELVLKRKKFRSWAEEDGIELDAAVLDVVASRF